jgi:hypothetical protein
MQRIDFIEIANLCCHFTYLRKKSFDYVELKNLFSKSRIFSFPQSFKELIEICNRLQLMVLEKGIVSLNPVGIKIATLHKSIKSNLELKLKKFFIKEVLFDLRKNEYCPAGFLNKFHVDTTRKTFVYERTIFDSYIETNWLINLSSIGLIEIDQKYAFIKPEYLEITNILLRDYRSGVSEKTTEEDFRNKIGDFAEQKAMKHEEDRLKKNGFDELSKLIQRISLVDKYAGYDILSFLGKGKFPEENIYIEVKGTTDDKVKFILTRNEIQKSREYRNRYFIYSFQNIALDSNSFTGPEVIKDPSKTLTTEKYYLEPTRLSVEKK